MKDNKFTCAVCRGTFEKGWPDDEAEEVLKKDFPGAKVEECATVCAPCYERLMDTSFG